MTEARQSGGFLLVVGNSSVGKTRLLYEAARDILPDFAVLVPDLGNGEVVNRIGEAKFHLPKLIVWLDELQRFLAGPYLTPPGSTAITAAAIRRLVDAPTPVVIVGALWPEHAAELRATEPDPDREQRQRTLYPEAMDILQDRRVQEIVLHTFSAAEREQASRLASQDPRLAEALADHDYNITEFLAGAPELMRRYERASEEQAAILLAAVDARRVGIQAPLTAALLYAAARGNLRTVHENDSWFPPALAELTRHDRPQDRATAPLIPLPDAQHTSVVGYTVADYLQQRLARKRRCIRLRDATWQAFADYSHDREDAIRVARAAGNRLRYRYAEHIYRRLADGGDPDGAGYLVGLLARQGRLDEAIAVSRAWAENGDDDAAKAVPHLLAEAGQTDELRALSNAGDQRAADELVIALAKKGQTRELQDLADAGDAHAADRLVGALVAQCDIDALRKRADAGDWYAATRLADLLTKQGRLDELRAWADAGSGAAAYALAIELAEQNRIGELRTRVSAGDKIAASVLGFRLAEQGSADEAIGLLRTSADGDMRAAKRLADLLAEQGQIDEAVRMLQTWADAGDKYAAERIADLLAEQGDTGGLRIRADAGDSYSAERLADLLSNQGRIEELRTRMKAGDRAAFERLPHALAEHGEIDEALRILRIKAKWGVEGARGQLDSLLAELGRDTELRAGADAGDREAAELLLDLLARQGRSDEAIEVCRNWADTGHRYAAELLPELLAGHGDVDEAIEMLRTWAEGGDNRAAKQLAELLTAQGRIEEALELCRTRADAGDWDAARQLLDILSKEGRTEELRAEVDAGVPGAAARLAAFLTEHGDAELASELLTFGLNADGSLAGNSDHRS